MALFSKLKSFFLFWKKPPQMAEGKTAESVGYSGKPPEKVKVGKPWDLEPSEILQQYNILHPDEINKYCRAAYPQVFALLDQDARPKAADLCKELLKTCTSDWRLYALLAFCKKGNTVEVYKNLTAALELDPDNVPVLRARCSTLGTKQRYLRHIEDLNRLLELDPERACEYWSNRAWYYHWTDQDDAARVDLQSILEHPEGQWVRESVDFMMLAEKLAVSG